MGIKWKDGYSADVRVYLVIGEEALDVAQVGPEFLVLAESRDIQECFAEIVVEVDGRRTLYPVVIEGATVEDPIVRFIKSKQATVPAPS
jgi:hypothetical protein